MRMVRELEVVGEASSRVSTEIKSAYPAVPWRLMKDFRNVLSHEYFGINEEIVLNEVASCNIETL